MHLDARLSAVNEPRVPQGEKSDGHRDGRAQQELVDDEVVKVEPLRGPCRGRE